MQCRHTVYYTYKLQSLSYSELLYHISVPFLLYLQLKDGLCLGGQLQAQVGWWPSAVRLKQALARSFFLFLEVPL